jgi:hypothetical protein
VEPLGVRLRQAVLVAADLALVVERLRSELGLGQPFADPGVAHFGLHNAVCALGDTFLEVVSPTRPDTAAGRYLQRRGSDCGYMVIFQLEELGVARKRVHEMGIRVVWQTDLPDIAGTHLHPVDMRGAIVSLDRADPPGSWRWGGPEWTGRVGSGAPGRVLGVTIDVMDPDAVAGRWAQVLGVPLAEGAPRLQLDAGYVAFAACKDPRAEGLREIDIEVPEEVRRGRHLIEIGGVGFRLQEHY